MYVPRIGRGCDIDCIWCSALSRVCGTAKWRCFNNHSLVMDKSAPVGTCPPLGKADYWAHPPRLMESESFLNALGFCSSNVAGGSVATLALFHREVSWARRRPSCSKAFESSSLSPKCSFVS